LDPRSEQPDNADDMAAYGFSSWERQVDPGKIKIVRAIACAAALNLLF